MKSKVRIGLFLTVLLVSAALSVAVAEAAVRIDVVSSDTERIVLEYTIDEYTSEPVSIEGKEYSRIRIPGEPVSFEKGSPALPFLSRSIVIPDDAQMSVQVISASFDEIPAAVAPSKGILPRSIDPAGVPFEFGETYGADALYPDVIATLGRPYILRDHRGLVIRVDPFQVNPVTGVLRVYTHLTVEITAVGPGKENVRVPRTTARPPVRAFEDLYRAQFLNYEEQGRDFYDPLDEQGDMLIIAYDPWIENLSAFVSHKAAMGITATVVGVSTIGNDSTSIQDYIQSVYDTSDLAFVLLVGDAAEVATPIRVVGYESGAADPLYAKLEGADDYPDIMVGRFSAQTLDQLQTQLDRTVTYETLPAVDQDWYWRGTGVASAQGAGQGDEGQADYVHMDEIRDWLLAADWTHVDQIYDPGATDTQVSNAINAGRGVANYCGHGSPTSWGTTGFNNADVNNLVNDNMLPFIVSVACNNGEFHHYAECFAEAWLRATNDVTGEPTGAVGMYASSVSQSWAPPMEAQDEFNLLLTDPTRPYRKYATLCYAGSCSMMDKYGASGVEMFDTWIVFGDPSLHVVGDPPPVGLNVEPPEGLSGSGPAGGPVTPESTVYALTNYEEVPIDYEVTYAAPWITVTNAAGTLSPGGTTTVTVSFNDGSCNQDCGAHSDTVVFTNLTNARGGASRPVSLKVGAGTTLRQWTFESDPGWTAEGEWAFGTPTGGGGGKGLNPDPASAATGSFVYGANLNGNISKFVGPAYYLTAGPLDLTGCFDMTLSYQRWLNTFGPPGTLSTVDVSADGSTWSNVWSSGGQIADAAWTPQTLDISTVADDGATVYVRWGYQVAQKIPQAGSGWNIDDVALSGMPSTARITLLVEPDRLSWSSAPGSLAYDVVRGDIDTLQSSAGDFSQATEACLGDDLAGMEMSYTDTPPPGSGHWFLVRGISTTGPMTYQTLAGNQVGLRDAEIEAAAATCP